jgi:hypothetical protein
VNIDLDIDGAARRAGGDLRTAVRPDVEAALAELHAVAPRRRRAHVTVAVLAAAAACLVLVGVVARFGPVVPTTGAPVDRPPDHRTYLGWNGLPRCGSEELTCFGDRRYGLHLDAPVTWTLPRGFSAPYAGTGWADAYVETYLSDRHGQVIGGVSILEHAQGFTESGPRPGPLTAAELTTWIAGRPFRVAGPVRATALAGRPAWDVDVVVRPHLRPGPETCIGSVRCYPLLSVHGDGPVFTGVWPGLISRFTALDLPGGGTTVVWSWSFRPHLPAALDRLLAGLRFG